MLTEVDRCSIPKERFPEYETRLAYAKALKNAPRGRRSGTKAQAIIDDTAHALGDENPPKLRTVQGYVRVLRASGGDAKFLISLHTVSRRRALRTAQPRSEEHTSELQSLMRISYAVFCLKKHTNAMLQSDDLY